MIYSFKSIFANEMQAFLTLISSTGGSTGNYQTLFTKLDKYMCLINWNEKALSEKLINNWLKTLKNSSTTIQQRICGIRRFARYLNALEIQAFEPEMYHATTNYIAYTFSDEEFTSIIKAADNFKSDSCTHSDKTNYSFPLVLRLLYGCGLRIGEVFALYWEDINLETDIITIRESKNKKQRRIPANNSLIEILKSFKNMKFKSGNNSPMLFEYSMPNKEISINRFRRWYWKVLKKANVSDLRTKPHERSGRCVHAFRHYFTYKSFLKAEAEGLTLEEFAPYLSAYLGHEHFRDTEKYISGDYMVYPDSHKIMNDSIGNLFPEVIFE